MQLKKIGAVMLTFKNCVYRTLISIALANPNLNTNTKLISIPLPVFNKELKLSHAHTPQSNFGLLRC